MATLKIPIRWVGEMREMLEVERPLSEMGPAFFPRPRRWVSGRTPTSPKGSWSTFSALESPGSDVSAG